MIISQTPFRLSLFGGGTDFPQWYTTKSGLVLSLSLDKYCYISLRNLPGFFDHNYRIVYSKVELCNELNQIEHPAVRKIFELYSTDQSLELQHQSDLPSRSGIGSSSAFVVGLLKAIFTLNDNHSDNKEIASLAIDIEQNALKEVVGSQDQIACAMGGINKIEFSGDGWKSVSLARNRVSISKLESNLFMVYTGSQRVSSYVSAGLIENLENKNKYLDKIYDYAQQGVRIIESNTNIDQIGELLHLSWLSKKSANSSSSNERIEHIYNLGLQAGAIGGKLMGAGGGGFFVFYVPESNHDHFLAQMRGYIVIPVRISYDGTRIIYNGDLGF